MLGFYVFAIEYHHVVGSCRREDWSREWCFLLCKINECSAYLDLLRSVKRAMSSALEPNQGGSGR